MTGRVENWRVLVDFLSRFMRPVDMERLSNGLNIPNTVALIKIQLFVKPFPIPSFLAKATVKDLTVFASRMEHPPNDIGQLQAPDPRS